jgi:hypothetical protein
MPQTLTPQIILAAIAGFEAQKSQIDSQIADLRSMLDGHRTTQPTVQSETSKPRKKRSAAIRRKMALAQRARYAKLKKGSEPTQAVAAVPKKRVMSASARKRIAAAQKARWAKIKKSTAKEAA